MRKMIAGLCLLCGCSDDPVLAPPEPSLDAEACEHLTEGPFNDVTAAAAAADGPSVDTEHTAHRIELASEGYVSFGSDEAGDLVVFLDAAVPFTVEDDGGVEIELEESCNDAAGCSSECGLVLSKYLFDLEVGSYAFHFGPSSETTFLLVHERAEHMHE